MDSHGRRLGSLRSIVVVGLSIAVVAAMSGAASAQDRPDGDVPASPSQIRAAAVVPDDVLREVAMPLTDDFPGVPECDIELRTAATWRVRDVTEESVYVESVRFQFDHNRTQGSYGGYVIRLGDGTYVQGEDTYLETPIDIEIDVSKALEWRANAYPLISFGVSVQAQREAGEQAPGPCGGPVGEQFQLYLEPVTRLAGAERIGTAVATAQDLWADRSASAVTIASSQNFPDALAGGSSAGAAGGPLLLSNPDLLSSQTRVEIARVLAPGGVVRVLGGEAAVSAAVVDELRAMGHDVVRVAGVSRYQTAVRSAEATVPSPTRIYVTDGDTFEYAMISGAAAAVDRAALVLTSGSRLPAETASYLDAHPGAEVVAVGRAAATAVPHADAIASEPDDPYTTSVLLARRVGGDAAFGVALGEDFPDGLTGGAHIGARGGPLLLSGRSRMPQVVHDYIADERQTQAPYLYGGVAALSTDVGLDARGLGDFIE